MNPYEQIISPTSKTRPITMDCVELSSSSAETIDSMGYEVIPPITTKKVVSSDRVGMTDEADGYDETDPTYRKARLAMSLKQDAYVCLYGCPKLHEATPGNTTEDKAQALLDKGSQSIVAGLAYGIRNISYGSEGIDFFTNKED
jgi:hypothetical protein